MTQHVCQNVITNTLKKHGTHAHTTLKERQKTTRNYLAIYANRDNNFEEEEEMYMCQQCWSKESVFTCKLCGKQICKDCMTAVRIKDQYGIAKREYVCPECSR